LFKILWKREHILTSAIRSGETTNSLCQVSWIFLVLLRFYFICESTSKLEIEAAPRLRSTATLPCMRLMPTSHSLTSGQDPHHLGPPARPFHGTHEVLQHVQFASDDPPALPFDWIQSCLAHVDLDLRTNSAAQAPAASEIYLACCCCRECSYLVQSSASNVPQHEFILKILLLSL
jgi:hypothetical protein